MNCKGRVLVELVDNDFVLSCGPDSTIRLVQERESQIQEFLLLLLSDLMPRNGSTVVFVGKDMEDEAMMLQYNDSQEFLCWVPFNIDNILVFEIAALGEGEVNVFSLVSQDKKVCMKIGSDGIMKLALASEECSLPVEFRLLQAFLDNDDTTADPSPAVELSADNDDKTAHTDDTAVESELAAANSSKSSSASGSPITAAGPLMVTAHFGEGPLGMTLRRRPDGVIYIHDVEENTQADTQDVQAGDEVWSVGSMVLGNEKVQKEQWMEVVQHIKTAERPLEMVLRRYSTPPDMSVSSSAQSVASASTTPTSQLAHSAVDLTPNVSSGSIVSMNKEAVQDHSQPCPTPNSRSPSSADTMSPIANDAASPVSPSARECPDLVSLSKLAARLVFKEKEKSGADSALPAQSSIFASRLLGGTATADKERQVAVGKIVKEGRRLIKHGSVCAAGRRALWNVQNKKFLFLLSDLLLVTVGQGDKFIVETTIDLATCKLNIRVKSDLLDPATTNKSAVFELLYPGGSMVIICDDEVMKTEWVHAIFNAICAVVGEGAVGWKHQYMLGTMHSAVLSRDARKVSDLLESCLAGELEFSDMESADDEGYTPLHYSCLLRLTNITRILHESNADVTIPDSRGMTAIHWAALQLDYSALEMLCTHVFNVDIIDYKDRTPLYLACVEGRDVQGHTDVQSLKKCMTCLMQAGANPNLQDKEGLTALHYLSASWQWQAMEAMITAVHPTTGVPSGAHVVNLNVLSDIDGWSALHYACGGIPLKRVVGEGQKILQEHHNETSGKVSHDMPGANDQWRHQKEETKIEDSIGTLRVLLRNGAYPNAKDHKARRPIDLLASNITRWTENLQPSLLLLMAHGTRIDEGVPEALKTSDAAIVLEEGQGMWAKAGLLNGDEMGLPLKAFEGLQYMSNAVENKPACALCRSQFTMFRRQHHCRLCDGLCCNECSGKKVTIDKAPVRVCDSCYNITANRADFLKAEAFMSGKGVRQASQQSQDKSVSRRNEENREVLFGDFKKLDAQSPTKTTYSSSQATMASMAEAKQQLHERGDKLEQLSDKSAKLADSSKEFAKLAKQIREQQQQSWW